MENRTLARGRRAVLITAAALCLQPFGASAEDAYPSYPSKPVRLLVAYPAGGLTDTLARALAEGLGKRLGQTIVVENKGGAGGIIGTDQAVKAAPDGYTLLLTIPVRSRRTWRCTRSCPTIRAPTCARFRTSPPRAPCWRSMRPSPPGPWPN
ncbi:exported hypothetical protein [Cupriavidus oxalaticus]|uniref:Extra-cytoplasmic solute receptor n=1 Tax=Cupriavidus oxalaticus TaxID=96344 RepID=A0A375FKX9_9BURK|nr:exported hypothetical protein [Cupriavidus oxalaticus]SPC23471.1 exported hypothetical protein [Cupriavidus oxalaticus]